MSLNFGHDEHPPNHVHNIKPLVALPYYQLIAQPFTFHYTDGINLNIWRSPSGYRDYMPTREMYTKVYNDFSKSLVSWIIPKNTQFELYAHTFDDDNKKVIDDLTMRYEFICYMYDGTVEYKLIDEFNIKPWRMCPGIVNNKQHYQFSGKKWFLSDILPNYESIGKLSIRIKNTASSVSGLNNESVLEVMIYSTSFLKQVNDAMIQTIEASTQTT